MTWATRWAVSLLFLAAIGCSPGQKPAPDPSPTPPAAPAREERCLPVVARECGCVYPCGVGSLQNDGRWSVTHAGWKDHTLAATIQPWCVEGECTDVFDAEIVCAGICRPKPADPTCHFDARHACVSGRAAR